MYSSYSKIESAVGRLVIFIFPLFLAHHLSNHFFQLDSYQASNSNPLHPIPKLIAGAEKQHQKLLSGESKTYSEAYRAYVQHRGRRPPPGFEQWFLHAKSSSSLVIESFWDQIYDDLEPFWSVPVDELRLKSYALARSAGTIDRVYGVWIRNGSVSSNCLDDDWCCSGLLDLIRPVAKSMPDLDLPYKGHLSPRVFPLWEDVRDLRMADRQTRHVIAKEEMRSDTESIGDWLFPEAHAVLESIQWDHDTPPGYLIPATCPPGSAARENEGRQTLIDPHFSQQHSVQGFVSDYRKSMDICKQPDLLHFHGIGVNPPIKMTTESLLPLFTQSPLAVANPEITIPANMYHQDDEKYWTSELYGEWSDKKTKAVWRGTNSGGKHNKNNWAKFHRHRFVLSMNSTYIAAVAANKTEPLYAIPEDVSLTNISHFAARYLDVGFSAFVCSDNRWRSEDPTCSYLDEHFQAVPRIELKDMLKYKYLPDIDGHGHSGKIKNPPSLHHHNHNHPTRPKNNKLITSKTSSPFPNLPPLKLRPHKSNHLSRVARFPSRPLETLHPHGQPILRLVQDLGLFYSRGYRWD